MNMNIIRQFLFFALVLICLSHALAKIKTDEEPRTESEEKLHSLLDLDDDEDDEGNSTSSSTTPKPTKPANNSTKKSKSRQIALPDDYNKLEIPVPNRVKFIEAFLGPEIAREWDDINLDELVEHDDDDDDNDDLTKLEVSVDVRVRSIRDVDEIDEEITIEMDFITKWLDMVILFENKENNVLDIMQNEAFAKGLRSLDPVFIKRIWKPDLFIENVVSISRPELISKPIRLLFSPSGLIIFSTRVTIKMDCDMEFHYYPADTQECIFKIRSYSYTTKDLKIRWDAANSGPFLMDRSEHNFDIKLDKLNTTHLVEAEGLIDGNYSERYAILQFKVSARRKLSYHLIQTYLPSTFFIIITWLSFLVPTTMVEARIGISMTTLLTLTSMFSSVRENTPVVSYVKAIDIWMVACIFFVFITLLEFTLLTWRRHLKGTDDDEEPSGVQINSKNEPYDALATAEKTENIEMERLSKPNSRHSLRMTKIDIYLSQFREESIEKYGFIAFSLLFVIFNLIYWPWLLISSDYFNWDVDLKYNVADD